MSPPHRRVSSWGRPGAPTRHARVPASPGQASVEFVSLLPVLLVVLAMAWQAVLAGEAAWQVRVAARAAARAAAVGSDATRAARTHLPRRLERGLRVVDGEDGDVRVSLRVPEALPGVHVGRVSATAHFEPQTG